MEINEDLKNKVKLKMTMSKMIDEINAETIQPKPNFIFKKWIAVACVCVIFTTGIVFAKEIENFIKDKFSLGKGVQTAVDNGYIEHLDNNYTFSNVSVSNENNNYILDNFDVGIKINDFMMAETNLSIEFEIKFDEKINKYKDLSKKINGNTDFESFGNLELNDLFILDEENKLICSSFNKETFEDFCNKHDLSYKINEFSENYFCSTTNSLPTDINSTNNTVKLVYTISPDNILNSKHLTLYFNKLKFTSKPGFSEESDGLTLTGNWKFDIDIPEYMYNHEDIFYEVVSCENKDFDVYEAKATDTGFEIGIIVSNIEKPTIPEELINPKTGLEYIFNSKEELLEVSEDKRFEDLYIEFNEKNWPIRVNGSSVAPWIEYTDGCYVTNSHNKKFNYSSNPSRKQYSKFLDGNKFDFYETFDLTKYDATNTLTVIIEVYGKPYCIKFQKI